MNWEDAVKQFRRNPTNLQSVLDNYFEEDIYSSAERFFVSEEFNEVVKYIPNHASKLLDIGAGRGIASYAFAKTGLQVVALEPDLSDDVGSGAIKLIAQKSNLKIDVVESFGESLPFADHSFDVVYARQVLHHASDLKQFCKEAYRVLKPNGVFIATREHVLSKEGDLEAFLSNHPLHKDYGGEHAFTLKQYTDSIEQSGLLITNILHPYSTVINFAPLSVMELRKNFSDKLSRLVGNWLAKKLMMNDSLFSLVRNFKAENTHQPGRLYSFIATKP
jgi:ubiquinone/menaquinone biosynthesis C-methylase UbiE